MFGLDKKKLSISDVEYELVDEKISEFLQSKGSLLIEDDFLIAGGTSVLIKRYIVDDKVLTISISDDGIVNISGQKNIINHISSFLERK
ncbi:hypothetical protein [Alkalimonas amylolytica]|uniref:Uncharacterized protein n=1 Tax=Alkalimonas amylolytica TaxID=152573 RepID=A0A1H4FP86_ALKAM|nr:hypothetical protein [Alkalimonas amylolytica]SEA98951.1 hypothetical protein SAMN04488051_1122 [Alkalimonas amylolytica]